MTTEADRVIEAASDELIALSHSIHAEPELAFDEHRSAAKVVEVLRAAGFEIRTGIADLPTAFDARFGSGELVVGICAEYDALPGIGHACGHNIIAAAAVGAASAARTSAAAHRALEHVAGRVDLARSTQARAHGRDLSTARLPVAEARRAVAGEFDGIVMMYHDQGHIPIKLIARDRAVNVTLGLPIVRTSPSHGTAFDIAWRGIASAEGMLAAASVAVTLASPGHVADVAPARPA